MMSYGTGDKKSVVYTPAGLVFQMILQPEMRECLQLDKTIFDLAVGEGQFPCAELVLKLFYNLDGLDEEKALRALKSLYGADIQAASVAKAKAHLRQTLGDAYKYFTGEEFSRWAEADEIIAKNFYQADSLKLMREWSCIQEKISQFA